MNDFSDLLVRIFERGEEARLELADERVALAKAQLGDQDAQAALLLAYAPALRNGVAWYSRALAGAAPKAEDLEDVRSQVVLGLLQAIQAFNGEQHDRLAAIAPAYIRDAVATNASTVTSFSVPERTLKRFFGILRAADGNVFEATRLAPDYQMKADTFLAVLDAVRNVTSLDAMTTSTEEHEGHDVIAHPVWDGSEADVDQRILVEAAFAAVDTLEHDVIGLAYGFSDYDPVSDAEIGDRLMLGRAKAQRVRYAGLDKMRSALGVA